MCQGMVAPLGPPVWTTIRLRRTIRSVDDHPATEPAVSYLWDCVKIALDANKDPHSGQWPSPVRIEQLANELGLELASSTVDEWFKRWSIVPTKWEKFENLLKVLGAEKDRDWQKLYAAACVAKKRKGQLEDARRQLEETRRQLEEIQPELEETRRQLHAARREADQSEDSPRRSSENGQVSPSPGEARQQIRRLAAVVLATAGGIVVLGGGGAILWSFLSQDPLPSGTIRCAHVIAAKSRVVSAPDDRSKFIKDKYFGDSIRVILRRDAPQGWVAVLTPGIQPGYNWMHQDDLGELAPCQGY